VRRVRSQGSVTANRAIENGASISWNQATIRGTSFGEGGRIHRERGFPSSGRFKKILSLLQETEDILRGQVSPINRGRRLSTDGKEGHHDITVGEGVHLHRWGVRHTTEGILPKSKAI